MDQNGIDVLHGPIYILYIYIYIRNPTSHQQQWGCFPDSNADTSHY